MMKKILSIAGFILAFVFTGEAQTVQDIFGNTDYNVTWYGIDYSHAKIVGSVSLFGGKNPISPADLRDRYYPAWNHLILDEPEKYCIADMIHRKNVIKDFSMVKILNAAAPLDSMEVNTTPYYSQQEIQHFVSAYPIEDKAGIGLIFIAESMDRSSGSACYHVVFFKMDTKEIILQERLKGAARGAGIRNYWAGSFYNVMQYIQDSGYRKWRSKYGSSRPANAPDPNAPKW